MTYGRSRASWGSPEKPRRRNNRTESQLVKAAFDWLFAHGCFVYRQNTGAFKTPEGQYVRFGLKGSSDLVGLTASGRYLAVELKSEKGRLSDEQRAFRDKIEAKGGLYVLARSLDDLEAVKGKLT